MLIYADINNSYLQDVINVTMPYRFRNRKFSNITILSPPHNGRYSDGTAKLTLCEVEIYAGKIAYYETAIRYYLIVIPWVVRLYVEIIHEL